MNAVIWVWYEMEKVLGKKTDIQFQLWIIHAVDQASYCLRKWQDVDTVRCTCETYLWQRLTMEREICPVHSPHHTCDCDSEILRHENKNIKWKPVMHWIYTFTHWPPCTAQRNNNACVDLDAWGNLADGTVRYVWWRESWLANHVFIADDEPFACFRSSRSLLSSPETICCCQGYICFLVIHLVSTYVL